MLRIYSVYMWNWYTTQLSIPNRIQPIISTNAHYQLSVYAIYSTRCFSIQYKYIFSCSIVPSQTRLRTRVQRDRDRKHFDRTHAPLPYRSQLAFLWLFRAYSVFHSRRESTDRLTQTTRFLSVFSKQLILLVSNRIFIDQKLNKCRGQ